jgi:small subunit ribosomal protein S7
MAYKKFTSSASQLKPDPRFNNELVSKFINCLMLDGKKLTAQTVFYDAMEQVGKKITDADPIEVFEAAVENVKPFVEVRSKRVGGANYQVPMQVNRKRQQSLAIRWMLEAIRGRRRGVGKPTSHVLAEEIVAAFNKEGNAINKREQTHRMAEANKAFAHFAW